MSNRTRVIGFSGYAQTGKSTAATYIEEAYGFKRQHIATTLREMLAVLLRHNGIPDDMVFRYLEGDLKEQVIPEIGQSGRQLQISIGTEWGRQQVHNDLWANTWRRLCASLGRAMNDSVRFPNEEDAIRRMGGFTIMIKRPGTGPIAFKWKRLGPLLYRWFGLHWGVHDSERVDRLRPDFVLNNNGDKDDLYQNLDHLMWHQFGLVPLKKEAA